MNNSSGIRIKKSTDPTKIAGLDLLERCQHVPMSRSEKLRLNESIYDRIGQVGEGTYGKVYKAKDRLTGDLVALKQIRMEQEREGFPFTATREIKLLTDSHHPNIITLREIITHGTPSLVSPKTPEVPPAYTLVFDYMDHDLTGLLSHPSQDTSNYTVARDPISHPHFFSPRQTKCLFQQLLYALEFLHSRKIIHRDIKSSNLLIDNRGVLKLADFGLARDMRIRKREERDQDGEKSQMTNRVITLWYRPPELLLGATQYGPEIDMWSAGCILAELFTRSALFIGGDELSQLSAIIKIMGYPDFDSDPELAKVSRGWKWLSSGPKLDLKRLVPEDAAGTDKGGLLGIARDHHIPPLALELIKDLLLYHPLRRPTASQALNHAWFLETHPTVVPCEPHDQILVHGGEWHEWEMKWRRKGGIPPESQVISDSQPSGHWNLTGPPPDGHRSGDPDRLRDRDRNYVPDFEEDRRYNRSEYDDRYKKRDDYFDDYRTDRRDGRTDRSDWNDKRRDDRKRSESRRAPSLTPSEPDEQRSFSRPGPVGYDKISASLGGRPDGFTKHSRIPT